MPLKNTRVVETYRNWPRYCKKPLSPDSCRLREKCRNDLEKGTGTQDAETWLNTRAKGQD